MKNKSIILIISILIGIFGALDCYADTITIGFNPITQDVPLGNQAVVDLFISDLGDYTSPSLGGFDLYVYYDPTILSFSSYTLGPYLGNISSGEAQDISDIKNFPGNFPGVINLAELSLLWLTDPYDLYALQPERFTLASLTFDTLALGSSPLELSIYYDGLYGGLSDEWGNPLGASLKPGNINVVPEPGTILLVGSGLLGLGFLRSIFRKGEMKIK